ncbi:MAG: hypothetical protein M3Q57_01025 [Pseudomonadota bacterium]|nr:hypothetical protein [Pseudomonadota bacterium]
MDKKYWVIGGEYEDGGFAGLVDGTHKVAGPYGDERRARTEWTRMTFRDGCAATERYHIAVEPRA